MNKYNFKLKNCVPLNYYSINLTIFFQRKRITKNCFNLINYSRQFYKTVFVEMFSIFTNTFSKQIFITIGQNDLTFPPGMNCIEPNNVYENITFRTL